MKRFLDQDYYELLEIDPMASKDEIRRAYDMMKEAFRPDSIATYSLFHPEELFQIQKKIEEAYRVLMNDQERSQYDSKTDSSKVSDDIEVSSQNGDLPISSEPNNRALELDPELESFLMQEGKPCTGEILRRYREWKGVSLDQVSQKTRINLIYLQYIESDHFAGLPHSVYLRSYLYQYAEALEVNPQAVVDGYIRRYRRWQDHSKNL